MNRLGLALATSVVASVLAASPVSAGGAFVAPNCVIRDGRTYASTALIGTPSFGPNAAFYNRDDLAFTLAMPMTLVSGRYYSSFDAEKKYVEINARWSDGPERKLVLPCRRA